MPELPFRNFTLAFSTKRAVRLLGGEKLVLLQVALGAPDDLAVFDHKQLLVRRRHPAAQVLAVEKSAELPWLVCRRRPSPGEPRDR